jgi:hypothetical protein
MKGHRRSFESEWLSSEESNFDTPTCQDMSELGSRGIKLSRVFGIGSCRIMARRELGCEKKTLYVI